MSWEPQAWTHRLAPPGWPNSQVRCCQVTLGPQGAFRSPAVGFWEVWAQLGAIVGQGKGSHFQGSWQCSRSSPLWRVETSRLWPWASILLPWLPVLWKDSLISFGLTDPEGKIETSAVHYTKLSVYIFIFLTHVFISCCLLSYILKILWSKFSHMWKEM
jgi:hypothetical protein